MYASDFNADGNININDKTNPWELYGCNYGYSQSDGDLDGQAYNKDKNDFWVENIGKENQIPK